MAKNPRITDKMKASKVIFKKDVKNVLYKDHVSGKGWERTESEAGAVIGDGVAGHKKGIWVTYYEDGTLRVDINADYGPESFANIPITAVKVID